MPIVKTNISRSIEYVYTIVLIFVTIPVMIALLAGYSFQQEVAKAHGPQARLVLAWLSDDSIMADAISCAMRQDQVAAAPGLQAADAVRDLLGNDTRFPPLYYLTLTSELERLSIGGSDLWSIKPIALMPHWMIVVLLTVAAGALGSMLYVLKKTLRARIIRARGGDPGGDLPVEWFLMRPVLGIVTALAAYVFVKSGLLVVTQVIGGDAEANPYFMVVVGLIAGLLSWQAIDTIESAGGRLLDRSKPGWATGLGKTLTSAGKSPADLATILGADQRMVQDWIDQLQPVPVGQKTRVAAALAVPPEELFTYRPPWDR